MFNKKFNQEIIRRIQTLESEITAEERKAGGTKIFKGFGNLLGYPFFESEYTYKESLATKVKHLEETERKFNLLCKHLGLEYYKKEIKETNGKTKEYTQEGFRKIKIIKNK